MLKAVCNTIARISPSAAAMMRPLRTVPCRERECETDCCRSDNMEQGGAKEAHITGKEAGREIATRERSDEKEHIFRRGEAERYGDHVNDVIGRLVDRPPPEMNAATIAYLSTSSMSAQAVMTDRLPSRYTFA